jgi:predicted GTPase
MFCKLFAKEEPKPQVNYGKIIGISVAVVLAVAAAAFAVFKYLEKKKYDEYLEQYARENFHMQRADELIYIVEE